MRARRLLFCVWLPWSSSVMADVLDGAYRLGAQGDAERFEIAFGRDLEYLADERLPNGTLVVRLRAPESATGTDVEQRTLAFPGGELAPIRTVTLSGSPAKGYVLGVAMARVASVEVVPQADRRRLALRIVPIVEENRRTAAAPIVPPRPQSDALAAEGREDPRESLAKGRGAAERGEYALAVAAFTTAAASGTPEVRREALEMLGVAREYNGQKAHAKAAWSQFLAEFPDAPEAPRVRQRLLGLVTSDLPVRPRLEAERDPYGWNVFGNFAQFYRRHTLVVNDEDEVVGIDAMFTDADVIAERQGEHVDLSFRMSGSHAWDFADQADEDEAFLVSALHLEAEAPEIDTRLRVGRQSLTSAGVLGRFDGAVLGYSPWDWLSVSTVFGYALDSSFDAFSDDRPFYGLSGELTFAGGKLAFAPYLIEQEANGFTDRRAVGLETRWLDERFTAFSLVDYDVYFDELNNVYLYANGTVTDGTRLYASFDHRKSPYVSTQNALIGLPFEDLSELEREFAAAQIEEFANDRSMEVEFATLGFDQDVGERHHVGADVSWSDFSETEASADIAATPGRQDVYYALRWRGDEVLGPMSFLSAQLRYADAEDYGSTAMYLSSRFSLFDGHFLVYPRVLGDVREYDTSGEEQWRVLPSLRLDYRFGRHVTFELESGYEWTSRDMGEAQFDSEGYYVRFGYRSSF